MFTHYIPLKIKYLIHWSRKSPNTAILTKTLSFFLQFFKKNQFIPKFKKI